jgi:hypothetical protein
MSPALKRVFQKTLFTALKGRSSTGFFALKREETKLLLASLTGSRAICPKKETVDFINS